MCAGGRGDRAGSVADAAGSGPDALGGAETGVKQAELNDEGIQQAAAPSSPAVEVGLLVPLWMNAGAKPGVAQDASFVAIRPASLTDDSSPTPPTPSTELMFVRRVKYFGSTAREHATRFLIVAVGDDPS